MPVEGLLNVVSMPFEGYKIHRIKMHNNNSREVRSKLS